MSLFRDSSEIIETFDKILIWGPTHTGKTHAALSWPDPAVVDLENRDAHFKDRFRFKLASVPDLDTLAKVLKELKSGALGCSSFVFDSHTASYLKLCQEHTSPSFKDGKRTDVTDYTTVNKRDDAMFDFIFSIANRNVIIIAHSAMKYDFAGGGERGSLKKRGVDFKGQEKFRFAFDYIFRTESQGDPRVKPAKFHVEKSASPNVKIGDVITGLDYAKFVALTRGAAAKPSAAPPLKGEALADAQARGDAPKSDAEPILERQAHAIENLCKQHNIGQAQLKTIVREVTKRTSDYQQTTSEEAALIIREMGHAKAGAA